MRAHRGDLVFRHEELGIGFVLRLAQRFTHLVLQIDHRLHGFVAEVQRFHHQGFGNFIGAALHHEDGVLGAGDAQIERAGIHLGCRGISHECAVDVADAHRADRSLERNVADGQRRRSAVDRQNVDLMFAVGRQRSDDHLHVVAEIGGEQRAQGPIGQAADQNAGFAGPAFAPEERAGNAARGVQALFVFHAQREKVDAFTRRAGHGGRGQDDGVAQAHRHRAVGLTGQFAGFDRDRVTTDSGCKSLCFFHE